MKAAKTVRYRKFSTLQKEFAQANIIFRISFNFSEKRTTYGGIKFLLEMLASLINQKKKDLWYLNLIKFFRRISTVQVHSIFYVDIGIYTIIIFNDEILDLQI